MRIGYARVSTDDQSLDLQLDALRLLGCDHIFSDHGVSALAKSRPGLERALRKLSTGDTLAIWRLDRLCRSLVDLLDLMTALNKRGIALHSVCEMIDTSSASGRLVLQVMGAVAEFERAILIERTRAGMDAARARGVRFGRKPALSGEGSRKALVLLGQGMTVPEVAHHMGIGRSTLYRYVAEFSEPGQVA